VWRQSRGLDADGTAVKTTWEPVPYYGSIHTDVPTLRVAIINAGDLVKAATRWPGPRVRELTTLVHQARRFAADT
jgi:hypothetical protein